MPKSKDKTLKECPNCRAAVFQYHERGQVIGGKFIVTEALYVCVNCHSVLTLDALLDRPEADE